MAGESQVTPISRPDPSVMATEQLDRAMKAERDYHGAERAVLVQRLDDIDRATSVLNETVNRVPTDVQREVGHLRELMEETFTSIRLQFEERDTRAEREARDNTIKVDAALAAQKDSAAASVTAMSRQIHKIEESFGTTIEKLERTFEARMTSLSDKIEDVKTSGTENRQSIMSIVDRQAGTRETISDRRENNGFVIAAIGLGITLLVGFAGLVTWLVANSADPTPPPVVVPVEVTG